MKERASVRRLYDAHNHLQDERLAPHLLPILADAQTEGIQRMVVNGSSESDWPRVLELARAHPSVLPSFGYHPWYVQDRTPDWQRTLQRYLDLIPSGIGEIGLDRWIKDHDSAQQEEAFVWQLRLAAARNLPASIHCLQAWGRLLELLRTERRPACGFLLHSFGGPKELIKALADLGAYFSFPGYFAHERKSRQRETFRHVPPDRLLVETDAPDQRLPESRDRFRLKDAQTGGPLNHPANLGEVYGFAAEFLGQPLHAFGDRVEANFHALFGGIEREKSADKAGPTAYIRAS